MGKKLLTEGLHRILETFDDEDCPHEQYYRGILNEVIQGLDAGSHSELNGVLCPIIGNMEYAAYNLCEGTESELEAGIIESTCPERSLFIALRELKKLAGE